MLSIRSAAEECSKRFTEFPLNVESISRKLYAGSAEGSIKTSKYIPEIGPETTVIDEAELERFYNSPSFSHLVEVQRKKYEKKNGSATNINKTSNGVIIRENKPITGDIYIAPEGNGFRTNSILVVTKTGNNNIFLEEITPEKSREINNGEIISPCYFARSIAEVNTYNYYGNAHNIAIVSNKIANNCEF